MAIGKREQVVGLCIAVLGSIFLTHMFIFKPKADEFATVAEQYNSGLHQLSSGAVLDPPNLLGKENEKTAAYRDQLSSVTSQLNLSVPTHFVESKKEDYEKRLDNLLTALRELVKLRDTVKAPILSFLGDRRFPQNPYVQLGWNLPSRLPLFEQIKDPNQAKARLWDLVTQLENHWTVANNISDPIQRMQYRVRYNEYLMQLGINPVELSDFYYKAPNANTMIFFNDKKTFEKLGGSAQINSDYSVNRYGVFLPDIKRVWMLNLIWDQKDNNTRITKDRLWEVLEIQLPFDDRLLFSIKQIESLSDVIKMASKANVQEIREVRMLKPAAFSKQEPRPEQGTKASGNEKTAVPAQPAPAAGAADEKVAKGAGLEVYFVGTNASTFDFLFEVSTMPRTYALDDLYIHAMPDSTVFTTATVELVMKLGADATKPPAQ